MPEMTEHQRDEYVIDTGHRRFQVTVYIGGLKITGIVFYAADTRSSSRRASDFIHSVTQERLTLSSPKVYERTTGLVIDEPEFVMITMLRVDTIYAKELENE